MDHFSAYGHALAALAAWGVIVSVLGLVSTRGRTAEGRCDCGKPKRDYSDPVYRRERAFMNAVETSPAFIAVTLAAILAGGTAFWVNVFASVFIVARIAMAVIHIRTENQPMRSATFMVALVCIIALAIAALRAVF